MAQLKREVGSSATAEAAAAMEPEMEPGLGGVEGMVKTKGSGVGGESGEGLRGGIREERGKRR